MPQRAQTTFVFAWEPTLQLFAAAQAMTSKFPVFTVTAFAVADAPYLVAGTIGKPPLFNVCTRCRAAARDFAQSLSTIYKLSNGAWVPLQTLATWSLGRAPAAR